MRLIADCFVTRRNYAFLEPSSASTHTFRSNVPTSIYVGVQYGESAASCPTCTCEAIFRWNFMCLNGQLCKWTQKRLSLLCYIHVVANTHI